MNPIPPFAQAGAPSSDPAGPVCYACLQATALSVESECDGCAALLRSPRALQGTISFLTDCPHRQLHFKVPSHQCGVRCFFSGKDILPFVSVFAL